MHTNWEKFVNFIETGRYGSALNQLLEISENDFKRFNEREKLTLIFIKGMLWELLKNFPQAKKCYSSIIQYKTNFLIVLQYMAHLQSTIGNISISKKLFHKLLNLSNEFCNPFKLNRSILGFRDRTEEIKYLKSFQPKSPEDNELKNKILGFTNFSLFNIKKSLKYFNKLEKPGKPVKIFTLIGEFFLYHDEEILNKLTEMHLNGKDDLSLLINKLLKNLAIGNYFITEKLFNYNPVIPNHLKALTNNINGWLDLCE